MKRLTLLSVLLCACASTPTPPAPSAYVSLPTSGKCTIRTLPSSTGLAVPGQSAQAGSTQAGSTQAGSAQAGSAQGPLNLPAPGTDAATAAQLRELLATMRFSAVQQGLQGCPEARLAIIGLGYAPLPEHAPHLSPPGYNPATEVSGEGAARTPYADASMTAAVDAVAHIQIGGDPGGSGLGNVRVTALGVGGANGVASEAALLRALSYASNVALSDRAVTVPHNPAPASVIVIDLQLPGLSQPVTAFIRTLLDSGVRLVAPASDAASFPAQISGVVAVTALSRSGAALPTSGHADVAMVGENPRVRLTSPQVAAAHLGALLALRDSLGPDLSSATVYACLRASGSVAERTEATGYGLIDASKVLSETFSPCVVR